VRRSSERYAVDLRVELSGREVVVHDVSQTGMFVATPLPVGDEIELVLGSGRARAQIVHRLEGVARPGGVGVAFRDASPQFIAAIDRVIQRARGAVTGGHVVVGDPDPRVAERLSTALATAGFTVATATNGLEVLGACARRAPSLILIDLATPTIDGMGLLDRLACEVAAVPVIVMSNEGGDIARAFDRGAADFLAKPFTTLEVVARVRRLALASHPEQIVLAGSLGDVGLGAVLTLLEMERKTGRLVLKNGHTAWIDVVDGRIVDAGWSLADDHARNIVMSVLDWSTGSFKLVAGSPPRRDPAIAMPITHLILEQARLRDEASARRRLRS
jgi:CheY-like chemotaxis protein